jgi:hypothetical protein
VYGLSLHQVDELYLVHCINCVLRLHQRGSTEPEQQQHRSRLRVQFPNHCAMIYFIHYNIIYCHVCWFRRNIMVYLCSTVIVPLLALRWFIFGMPNFPTCSSE